MTFIAYLLRSAFARRGATLGMIATIAITVGATCTMLALLEGLTALLGMTGRADNAIVIEKNASDEETSILPHELENIIAAAPGIAVADGHALVSCEVARPITVRSRTQDLNTVMLRAVNPVAFTVHPAVHVVQGVAPSPGQRGVLVGAKRVGLVGTSGNDFVRVGTHRWPVLGVFSAPGTTFESELWADRKALSEELHGYDFSVASVRLSGPGSEAELARSLAKSPAFSLEVVAEDVFYARRLAEFSAYIQVIVVLAMLFAAGAIAGCVNTVSALFIARRGEIATLLAIGYTRRRVMAMLVVELVVLSLLGGAVGLAMTALANGHTVEFVGESLVFPILFTPRVALAGVAIATFVGVAASLAAVLRTQRLDILSAIREG